MPYLQVEVDVIEVWAERLGAAVGITTDQAIGGLCRLWHLAWKRKVDRLSRLALGTCFPNADVNKLTDALVEFEFLRPLDEQTWLVRGADRRLGLLNKRREAAEKTNAKRWGSDRSTDTSSDRSSDRSTDKITRGVIGPPIGQASVLHPAPSTQHPDAQTPNTSPAAVATGQGVLVAVAPLKPAKEAPDLIYQPFVDQLTQAFLTQRGATPSFEVQDFAALKRLRKKHPDDEILKRWQRGLAGAYAREVNSLAQLATAAKWNALATDTAAGLVRLGESWTKEQLSGPLRGEEIPWEKL